MQCVGVFQRLLPNCVRASVCVRVCMYVCMYVCIDVWMYDYIYVLFVCRG